MPANSEAPGTRMFVLTLPGLGALVARELGALAGVRVTGTGNDGRSDVITCEVRPGRERALLGLRTAEDVFVEIGRTLRAEGDQPPWIAKRLWKPNRVGKALALWRATSSGRGTPTYRVVVRVLQERSFRRTQLRRAVGSVVSAAERSWREADPARLELWVVEYDQGKFLGGMRLTTAAMRQHGGRPVERTGALRPAVAAAMVSVAGLPPGVLLDPCCGSGTILTEAAASGWTVVGRDIDPAAVRIARRNVRVGEIEVGDARDLPQKDGSVDACVSNLPFGQQYGVEGDQEAWLRAVLDELARVTRRDGRVVLLSPTLPRGVIPPGLRLRDRYPMRLLGTKTTLWTLNRQDGRSGRTR